MNRRKFIAAAMVLPASVSPAQSSTLGSTAPPSVESETYISELFLKFKACSGKIQETYNEIERMVTQSGLTGSEAVKLNFDLNDKLLKKLWDDETAIGTQLLEAKPTSLSDLAIKTSVLLWYQDLETNQEFAKQIKEEADSFLTT